MTKKERHAFYKTLLKIVCKDKEVGYGMCWYISYTPINGRTIYTYSPRIFEEELPELWSLRPKEDMEADNYWFPCTYKGWEKRIALIEKCIELTK